MTFLNPLFLSGLSLLSIPILIHLLSRRRFKTIHFSAVRFLKLIEEDTIKKLKVRQWLLLLLRILIPLFLILGISRPIIFSDNFSLTDWNRNDPIYIVMDNSASMNKKLNGETLFDLAKSQVSELFPESRFPRNIRIFTTTDYKPVQQTWFDEQSKFIRKIQEIPASFLKGNLQKSLINIRRDAFVNNTPKNLAIIVTDLQDIDLPAFNRELSEFQEKNWQVLILPVQAKSENISVESVEPGSKIVQTEKPLSISCSLLNHSMNEMKVPVELTVNGIRSGQSYKKIAAEGQIVTEFELIPSQPGFILGTVSIEDEEPLDNQRFFTQLVPEKVKVLVTCPESEKTAFIRLFSIVPDNFIDYTFRTPEMLHLEKFSDYSVLIFANVPELSVDLQKQISESINTGTGTLFFFGDKVDRESYNNFWHQKMNFPLWKETFESMDHSGFLLTGDWDRNHSLFQGMWKKEISAFDSPEFFKAPLLIPSSEKMIITYSNAYPFLLQSGENTFIFSTDISGKWSDFNLRGLFPPLTLRAVQYLATGEIQRKIRFSYEMGDSLDFVKTIASEDKIKLNTPDNREIWINPETEGLQRLKKYIRTPGIYQLEWSDGEIYFAMNIPQHEITKKPLNPDNIQNDSPNIRIIKSNHPDGGKNLSGFGRETWQLFYLLTLITIFIEIWLTRESKQRRL